ncbi:MaoC family dehydratase [Gordonia jinhuaensis]|uniref:MaoC family dehydratase n=1 Tax=Gordonia jinhuaensis TaxID=1517702 RepID=A0A916TDQ0_9ACTN|nr:MaoC/PaaZ C-terminal domain-containing protein [Gordonia jinhuaensis]GGB38736.1 MaoC family dehydratase [Gordonia jinhuaensis]
MSDTTQAADVDAQIRGRVGEEIFLTDYHPITMADELAFQKATWVHEDFLGFPLESNDPYGEELVSGFLLMSILVAFHKRYLPFHLEDGYALNYGADKLRFLTPVLAGDDIRCRTELLDVTVKKPGTYRLLTRNTIEKRDGRPAMVADWITYLVDNAAPADTQEVSDK